MMIETSNCADIIAQMHPQQTNLLLIAEGMPINILDLIKEANEVGISLAGGIFPKVFSEKTTYDQALILKHIQSEDQPLLLKDIGKGKLDLELPDLQSSRSCFVFADGLMENIPRMLERLYEQYGKNINFAGGGAGSLTLSQQPCIFTNDGLYQDAALIVPTNLTITSGVKHGWGKIAGPFIANKTEGNKILELNWRPAFDVYKEIVEQHSEQKFESDDFFSIAKGFPFGINKSGHEVIVRDPISNDDGALTCVGNVSQNVSLSILQGQNEKLISSASEAANESLAEGFQDNLVIDCISRILYLEDDFVKELDSVGSVLKAKSDQLVEGALTLGEISSSDEGPLELYNKTIVVSTMS